jgi:hypothetical protein
MLAKTARKNPAGVGDGVEPTLADDRGTGE